VCCVLCVVCCVVACAALHTTTQLYVSTEWPPMPSAASLSPYAASRITSFPAEHLTRVRSAFVPTASASAARNTIVLIVHRATTHWRLSAAEYHTLSAALATAYPTLQVTEYVVDSEQESTDVSAVGLAAAVKAVEDGVQLFARAALVIGVHSSALSNVVYCAPGTSVLEIGIPASPTATAQSRAVLSPMDSLYYRMSAALGLDYWLLMPSAPATANPNSMELKVSSADVLSLLQSGGERHGKPAKPAFLRR
jgi:hypothetical protein